MAQSTLRGYDRDYEIPCSLRSLHPMSEQFVLFKEMRTGWDAVAGTSCEPKERQK